MIKKSEVGSQESKVRKKLHICLLSFVLCLLLFSMGCDAFVRKFTRKPKKSEISSHEIVLVPEEYLDARLSKQEAYRKYFAFWKSWQSELSESLSQDKAQKKSLDCIQESIKNLENLKGLLDQTRQEQLQVYIQEIKDLEEQVSKDVYGSSNARNARVSENIKRAILRDFSFNKIKDNLI